MTTKLLLLVLALTVFGSCPRNVEKELIDKTAKEVEERLAKRKPGQFVSRAERKADAELFAKKRQLVLEAKSGMSKEGQEVADALVEQLVQRTQGNELAEKLAVAAEQDSKLLQQELEKDESLNERCLAALVEGIAGLTRTLVCTDLKSRLEKERPASDKELAEALTGPTFECLFKPGGATSRGIENVGKWREASKFSKALKDAPTNKMMLKTALVELACL